jgi:tetratricopeptide (TPR) repeat protein
MSATARETSELLAGAREALARRDWASAYEQLAEADAAEPLAPENLMLLAEASYGAGLLEVTLDSLERAHREARRLGNRITAATAAARLAMHLVIDTGLMAPVRGWIKRAERELDGVDETPVHAWLALARACERMLAGDFAEARRWAEESADVGARHEVTAAAVFGRSVSARCLVFEGRIDEGLVLLEEAAESLFAEDLDPLTAGCLYCEVVCAWQGLARYDLAEQWTEAMERFSDDHAVGSINGRCRVHRAQILRLRGELSAAEDTAVDACEHLRPWLRYEFGWPLTELGRIRLARGDLPGAEAAFLDAHEMGWDAQPGLALLWLAQGDVAGAAASIRHSLEHPAKVPFKERPPNTDLQRAPLLEAQVEIAIAAADVETARAASDELGRIAATFGGNALHAAASLASGRVLLADGRTTEASAELQTAVRLWSEIGAPYETAIARTVLAHALEAEGSRHDAELELRAAETTLRRLRGAAASDASEPRSERSEFRREGDYWSIVFAGRTVHVRDMKGLNHLARLLAEPGREFHAVDLVALDRGWSEGTVRAGALDDAGELLDERAKEVYRRRLHEIEEDMADAETFGDTERVGSAMREREFLVGELARAVGLGGRDRRAGATSERARASVTRAIRNAITRVEREHPALGEHLKRAIRTGTYCAYLPDPRVPVDWVL